MPTEVDSFRPVSASLRDLLGDDYLEAVCTARAAVEGTDLAELRRVAGETVDFFPGSMQARLLELLPDTGEQVGASVETSARGASTESFNTATKTAAAPLTGYGYFRVGEDGRLHLITKCEHYHVPLGHSFPGFRLLENARRLGIPQATHNSTRGHITRLLEEELVRTAEGVLDRVLNLQTGSLAAEAALKLILARFHRVDAKAPAPPYEGRTPVIVVIGDDDGELEANYHGTTTLTQMTRGMWPGMLARLEEQGVLCVRCVRPNALDEIEAIFEQYDSGTHKVAGFFHEIVMMNYGARLLTKGFLTGVYDLCGQRDVATVVDEIQSCAWYPELYLFREYGLRPDFVAVGKGFSGGEYAASRLLFNSKYDSLPQFGALVTNGQEELASLSYLVTMRWAEANAEVTRAIGDYYEQRLRDLAAEHSNIVVGVDGKRHLMGIRFNEVDPAKQFAARLNKRGLDISVQTYKASCPPAALTKLPLIAGREVVDLVVKRMEEALS